MIKYVDILKEILLSLFGYTIASKRKHRIFKKNDITEEKINLLKANLDDKSIKIVDSAIYIINYQYKDIFPRAKISLYSKLYNMSFLKKLFIYFKYKIPFKLRLLPEVFHFDCGLKFINNKHKLYLKNKPSITAGAYWGDSALVLNDYTNSNVYAFEPNKYNLDLLYKTISRNKKDKIIIPIAKGLSDKNENLYFNNKGTSSLGSKFVSTNKGNLEQLPCVSIDSFIDDNAISNLGIIHLDVEGFETKVIQGAKAIITKYKPILLISIYHNAQDFFDLKPLIESWNLGYEFKIRKLARNRLELMLIATPII